MNTKYDWITKVLVNQTHLNVKSGLWSHRKTPFLLEPNSNISNLVITQQFRTSKTQPKLLISIIVGIWHEKCISKWTSRMYKVRCRSRSRKKIKPIHKT
ncbi:hypothetical protein HanRHA438_Chr15g0683551 [Helianthus annuus]|nr:hypothetical protein HanIR_Chr15g0729351 [Helianthus annuus]KAJ0842709.1 hypothetical protein HanRHA438_Chr15g0683551 [Helianthus annuus]